MILRLIQFESIILLQRLGQHSLLCSIPGDKTRNLLHLSQLLVSDPAVLAMEKHPSSLKVQKEGCSVLRHHAKAFGTIESKGLSAVVSALEAFADLLLHYLGVDCLRAASRDANCRVMRIQTASGPLSRRSEAP
jgi:hypothetical protein